MKWGGGITRADLKLGISFPQGILLTSAFIFMLDRNRKKSHFCARMEGYEKFWFLKGWCGVFLKDQFGIMSSSTAFDESWEWQFRDWSLRAGVTGQALLSWWITFVCLLRCTQRAVAEWRSQHTPGFARVCVSWETSRGPTDSDNESKTYVS